METGFDFRRPLAAIIREEAILNLRKAALVEKRNQLGQKLLVHLDSLFESLNSKIPKEERDLLSFDPEADGLGVAFPFSDAVKFVNQSFYLPEVFTSVINGANRRFCLQNGGNIDQEDLLVAFIRETFRADNQVTAIKGLLLSTLDFRSSLCVVFLPEEQVPFVELVDPTISGFLKYNRMFEATKSLEYATAVIALTEHLLMKTPRPPIIERKVGKLSYTFNPY